MKKYSLLLLAAAALVLGACTHPIETETVSYEESIPFHEGSKFSLELNLDIELPTAGFDAQALDIVRETIRTETLGGNFDKFSGTPEELASVYRNQLVEEYITSNEELLKEMGITEEEAFNLSWGTDISGHFGKEWKDWVNYLIDDYNYRGGAHGITTERPIVFNRKTGHPVDYSVFKEGVSEERLVELINQHKYDDFGEKLDGIDRENIFFVDPVQPGDHFTVDEDGITFYYQPYEVAAYVFGVVTIPISWNELKQQ